MSKILAQSEKFRLIDLFQDVFRGLALTGKIPPHKIESTTV